jgi:hypothetical protein
MVNTIEDEYFDWLCHLACGGDRFRLKSYHDLLFVLHDRDFTWLIRNDENRAEEGISLRSRFASDIGHNQNTIYVRMSWPCSILEMMVALAIRCEENIMDDPQIGDRTTQWFWSMIRSLGLNQMLDNYFDIDYVNMVLDAFLDRKYKRTGEGGLFTVRNCNSDLRDAEIWHQMCWYLDNLDGH